MAKLTNKSVENRKLVVIGLDGGSFSVIDPLIEEGRLPNIKKLMKEGVKGELLSTIPPGNGTGLDFLYDREIPRSAWHF